MTAMAISPQSAALLLLQTEPGINAVLNFGGPVGFAELPLIADAVLNSSDPVRFADPELPIADRADLVAARDALAWLNDGVDDAPTGDGDASVLVRERDRWLDGIRAAQQRTTPFPDADIVAGVIAVPAADHFLVVPVGGGAEMVDAVLLYGRHRRPSRWTLIPFARKPTAPATPLESECELSEDPTVDCVSNSCPGTCMLEWAFESRVVVRLGCGCH
jgi:hypothetical protein